MKKFSLKWKWITIGALMITVLCALTWELAFSKVLEVFLYHSLSNSSGNKLKINRIYKENEYWVIDSPTLFQGDQEDELIFKTAKALLHYTVDLWKGQINLHITLEHPEFKMGKQDPNFALDVNKLEVSGQHFHWNTFVTIHEGVLNADGYLYEIQGHLNLGSSFLGQLQLNFNDGQLFVDFSRDPYSTWHIDFNCQKTACFQLHHLASTFFPQLEDIKIREGLLEGTGGFILKRDHRPIFYAEANLTRFNFEHVPTQIKGLLQEVRFHLQKKDEDNSLSYGSIIFCGDEALTYDSTHASESEIRNLLGGIYVDDQAQAKIVLNGIYDNLGKIYQLSLNGDASFPQQAAASLNLSWQLEDEQRKSGGDIKFNELAERQYELQLNLNQLRFQDTVALQAMLHSLFPALHDAQLQEGIVDMTAKAYFNGKKLAKLSVDHITLNRLKAHYLPCPSVMTVDHLSAKGNFEFGLQLFNDQAALTLDFQNGKVAALDQAWKIDNIQTHFNISKGSKIELHAKGLYEGMQVCLDSDVDSGETFRISLDGKMKGLFQHIPHKDMRRKLIESFAEEELMMTANVKHLEQGDEWIGLAKIIDVQGQEKLLTFGFEISKKEPFDHCLEMFQKSLPQEILSKMNFDLSPSIMEKANESSRLHEGWFIAENLPLEKYLMPFFSGDNPIQLNGIGNFQGKFNQQALLVSLEAQQVTLDTQAFTLETPEIKQNLLKPTCYVDFVHGIHFGILPLSNASYLEKNSALLFSDINAALIFEGNNIHIPAIETFCHGIYMDGALDINFSDSFVPLDIDIRTQTLHGKFSQIQNFFSHIQKPLFFLKIPMEGEVSMHREAGHLHFSIFPDHYDMQIQLKGALSEGLLKADYGDVALQELSLNFDYDYKSNILEFSEIQGTLLVGEPERAEEYTVVGEKIVFSDYLHNRCAFDLWIGDKKRDMIRLAGETFSSSDKPDDVQFAFDQKLSHFGNVHPSKFHLILKDWWQIQEFHLIADFKLSTLFKDLQRFSRTGFLFLSRHALKKVNDIKKAEGAFKIDIEYHESLSQLIYSLRGEEIVLDDYHFKNASLEGKKADDVWMIEQLILDEISVAADILRKQGSWFINFLGLQIGKSLLLGLQGEYFDDSHTVSGKINLLEIDLAALKECPKALDFLKIYPLKGLLKATGQFHWEGNEEGYGSKFDALLTASVKNLQFENLRFEDIHQVSLHFASDRGVTAHHLNTALLAAGVKKAELKLEKFEYDLRQESFALENLNFSIPSFNLENVLEQIESGFSRLFIPGMTSLLNHVKTQGNLEGSLNFDYAAPHYGIKLNLKDGEYHLLSKKVDLSNFVLEYDPCEVSIQAKSLNQVFPFWLQYKSARSNQGVLQVTEEDPTHLPENPLIVKCQYDAEGFSIEEATGQLHGMTFNLSKDANKEPLPQAHFLEGEIKFNAKDAMALISQDWSEKLGMWQIGPGYSLKGHWELYLDQMVDDLFKIYFEGQLLGKNFEFKGYHFENLQAAIRLTPEQISMKNVHVNDPCGELHIADLRLLKQRNAFWKVILSKAEAQEFKPSLLQKVGMAQTESQKPLVIRELSLEDLQGTLGDSNSFVGKGSLVFVNPPKQNTSHPLFSIPGEILTHLGLDLAVLNPVVGTIVYEVKDSKIFLTKLKDAYSQGKMSKFYLPNSSFKSYVDFDGNLNVQIKMRHYNLFFKLAELFTVTVQGNLQKPTYSLQKQKK